MTDKLAANFPTRELELYHRLIEATPGVELKSNFGFPYTAVNGHMHSFLDKAGSLALRLEQAEREAFMVKFGASLYLHESGSVLKQYVAAPAELLADTTTASVYLAKSLAYAQTLKPKPPRTSAP